MPRPDDPPDVRTSKILAYILRHGAEKEGLAIRSDGFVKLNDVLARPKMRDTDLETVLRLVEENAKQRFEVLYGYDPSPPRPRAKGQGKGKGKFKAKLGVRQGSIYGEVDAAAIDGVRNDLAQVAITSERPECAELPLVTLSLPVSDEAESFEGQRGKYFIRAIQGHSLKLESTAHLTPVLDDEDGRGRAGLIVHGTQWELWETLKQQGLSRMSRQHIHLAPALVDHRITPRPTSTLFIHLDLTKLLGAGIPVYTSTNGVVLTPGNKNGFVPNELWETAERVINGERVLVWEEGKEVVPDAPV